MDIGFIGLGNMGFPMARRLVEAGHKLVVFDTRKEAVDKLVARGATAGARTGMSWPAGLVHLAGGDAFQADARPLRTPDRTVPVPDRDGLAGEGRAGSDNAGQQQKREHR